MHRVLEVCAFSARDAFRAAAAGAQRIELCRAPREDGLTPTAETLRACLPLLATIPVHPIVRPRDDFTARGNDVAVMCSALETAAGSGYPGAVIGLLRGDEPDYLALRAMMPAAEGLQVTFHRAFDHVTEQERALHRLAGLGVARVLTSGRPGDAASHLDRLHRLALTAADCGITLIAGGGVTPGNITAIAATGVREIHSSAGGSHSGMRPAAVRSMRTALDRMPG